MNLAKLPVASPVSGGINALDEAIQQFQETLSDNQRAELKQTNNIPTADDVMTFTAQLDDRSRATTGRSNASKVHTMLRSMRDFSSIVDTFVSSNPTIAALAWGAVKLTMMIATNIASYFEPLSNLFMGLTNHCPRFSEYQALYPGSIGLQNALCNFHAAIVRTCRHAVQAIQRPWHERLYKPWQGFEQEFKPDADEMKSWCLEVKAEILLAKSKADREDQLQQENERNAAAGMRKILASFISATTSTSIESKQKQIERRSRQEKQELLDDLSSYDHVNSFKKACRERLSNTAEWIFSEPQYESWKSTNNSSLLWCSGKIGSGKTILAGSLIEAALAERATTKAAVTYFFIDYKDTESQKPENILRSIVRQTLDIVSLSSTERRALKKLRGNPVPTLDDIVAILEPQIEKSNGFYIFIDGLDECERGQRNSLCLCLSDLLRAMSALKIYISSRGGIAPEIKQHFRTHMQVSTESMNATPDISRVIQKTLQIQIETGELVLGDRSILEDVCSILTKHADGMILWSMFIINELCTYRSDEEILLGLRNLPRDLEETFNRALSRISTRGTAQLAKRIFPIVAVTERSLTLDELREALAVEIGLSSIRKERLLNGIEHVATWCENLIQVDEETKTVQFPHSAVYDFFAENLASGKFEDFRFDMGGANEQLAKICITYLNLSPFKRAVVQRQQESSTLPVPNPMLIAENALKISMPAFKRGKDIVDLDINRALLKYRQHIETASSQHPFLGYAKKYWLCHTVYLSPDSSTWAIWKDMIIEGNPVAEFPWLEIRHGGIRDAVDWAVEHGHLTLAHLLKEEFVSEEEVMRRTEEKLWNSMRRPGSGIIYKPGTS